jgi:hypothetical protein
VDAPPGGQPIGGVCRSDQAHDTAAAAAMRVPARRRVRFDGVSIAARNTHCTSATWAIRSRGAATDRQRRRDAVQRSARSRCGSALGPQSMRFVARPSDRLRRGRPTAHCDVVAPPAAMSWGLWTRRLAGRRIDGDGRPNQAHDTAAMLPRGSPPVDGSASTGQHHRAHHALHPGDVGNQVARRPATNRQRRRDAVQRPASSRCGSAPSQQSMRFSARPLDGLRRGRPPATATPPRHPRR